MNNQFFMMQQSGICRSVCPEYRRARMRMQDAKRILGFLNRYDIKETDSGYKPVPHPMPVLSCPYCRYFHKEELMETEEKITRLSENIAAGGLRKEDCSSVLRVLAGFYPEEYRMIERAVREG